MSSRSERYDDQAITRSAVVAIDRYPEVVSRLPEPGTEWFAHDMPEYAHSVLDQFRRVGIITGEKVHNGDRHEYQTDPEAYRRIQAKYGDRDELPCGHRSGFETVVAGEEYECGFEHCGEVYDREIIEEVLL